MGTFRIEIQAVGNHGCQRGKKDGEWVGDCGVADCPDCMARRFLQGLRDVGVFFSADVVGAVPDPNLSNYARVIHWPGQIGEVQDDLLTGHRKGSFG